MRTGGQANVGFCEGAPGLPAATVGIGHRTGLIDTIKLDMESAGIAAGRNADLQGIEAIDRGIDGVIEPFPGASPTYIVATAGIRCGLDVHGGVAILPAVIRRVTVVISHSFTAAIEVLRLNSSGNTLGNTRKGRFAIDNLDSPDRGHRCVANIVGG